MNSAYADVGRRLGLTAQQGQLLCVLMLQPYGMGELGEVLGLAKSSLTGLVDRSEQRGLVRREQDPLDGRAVRVALTAKGAGVAGNFHAEARRRIEALPACLDEDDRRRLAELLSRVVADNRVPAVFATSDESGP
ncbi:MarR family winged helix-turn-helix transcriptional regulator [Saccharothrix coeruleofusca]|uniref:MarR family transcriptional regulator n=1 Tax=Saccharothrix coeruleofusca TaxID=33919 RepID=A0A918AGK8_9PSEU|nr:MarR family transcriptional regulator [Saccharothrix coeruleofusca]MBP2340633.1 DNA-binding MarR family transcriptional regulator [Saccharothrix coeruleofusca]GGP34185.1 MarR family transcriptional regulator [Saccharothrix coeruleofusca]